MFSNFVKMYDLNLQETLYLQMIPDKRKAHQVHVATSTNRTKYNSILIYLGYAFAIFNIQCIKQIA